MQIKENGVLHIICVLIVFNFFILGCKQTSPDPAAINTAIAQTQSAQLPKAQAYTATQKPTDTPTPTYTAVPATDAPEKVAPVSPDQKWSKNYAGSFESGGVTVEIARVVIGYKSAITDQQWDKLNEYISGWSEINVVGELIFKVTNNTDKTITIYLDQGSVQIGSEQIELSDYMIGTTFGDDIGGEIYPGVTKIGGMWFGIKRSNPDQVTSLIYRCDAPHDESLDALGPDVEINVNATQHEWEQMPDDLR